MRVHQGEEVLKRFRRRGITQKKAYNKEKEHFEDLEVEGVRRTKSQYEDW